MSFLVIAGQTIPVLEGQGAERREMDGVTVRTANFTLRSAYTATKRQGAFVSGLLTQAELDTLKTATANGAHVACSGDALGGSVTCEVLLGDMPYVNVSSGVDALGFMRTVSLQLREV